MHDAPLLLVHLFQRVRDVVAADLLRILPGCGGWIEGPAAWFGDVVAGDRGIVAAGCAPARAPVYVRARVCTPA